MSFLGGIQGWVKTIPISVSKSATTVTTELLVALRSKTPVKTGRAAAAWGVYRQGVDAVDQAIISHSIQDAPDATKEVKTLDEAKRLGLTTGGDVDRLSEQLFGRGTFFGTLLQIPDIDVSQNEEGITIRNDVPYIGILENGTAKRRPHHMVQLAIEEQRAKYG